MRKNAPRRLHMGRSGSIFPELLRQPPAAFFPSQQPSLKVATSSDVLQTYQSSAADQHLNNDVSPRCASPRAVTSLLGTDRGSPGPCTYISSLKQTCVPATRRRANETYFLERDYKQPIGNKGRSRRRSSFRTRSQRRYDFALSLEANGYDSVGSPTQHSSKRPALEPKPPVEESTMLPLTEAALRMISQASREPGYQPFSSKSPLDVGLTSFSHVISSGCAPASLANGLGGAFRHADDLLDVKEKAKLLSAVLPGADGNSNQDEDHSVSGTVGQNVSSLGGGRTSVSPNDSFVRRTHHPGVRRSLLSTLKCPSKKQPYRNAEHGGKRTKLRKLQHNLQKAHDCGQLTDASYTLLRAILQQCWSGLSADPCKAADSPGAWPSIASLSTEASTGSALTSSISSPLSPPTEAFEPQGVQPTTISRLLEMGGGSPTLLNEDDLDNASNISDASVADFRSSPYPYQFRQQNPMDSDVLWQQDAQRRHVHYYKSRLRGGHMQPTCRSPFDAVLDEDAVGVSRRTEPSERRRELKPLKIVLREIRDPESGAVCANLMRDLNMPGFVENFLKQLPRLNVARDNDKLSENIRSQALQLLSHLVAQQGRLGDDSECVHVKPPPPPSSTSSGRCGTPLWWDHDQLSVEERRLTNLVYGDVAFMPEPNPGISRARRSEAHELYRRLVRALDQRAPPQERLFAPTSHPVGKNGKRKALSTSSAPPTPQWASCWIRASRSRQLFGRGSNLFAGHRTRLADYDPDLGTEV
eukprot:Blabericola_migrator_1__13546@NODE_991_length_5780_cov_117_704534_g683_i0_p1_GENE_NODE_991_length_5780_cov_117_704534_g683_i0NODE_991_length_5780_cov_117_704534_g683_i0_p1_ORF_typecomplete_len756_score67_74SAM_LFY/PF01698_16/0_39_NODE_991_length_5780_cov_117_704534_g683_i012483515